MVTIVEKKKQGLRHNKLEYEDAIEEGVTNEDKKKQGLRQTKVFAVNTF